jgi:adhesin/invasin
LRARLFSRLFSLLALVVGATVACSDTNAPTAASIIITRGSVLSLTVGAQTPESLTVTVYDVDGFVLSGVAVTWALDSANGALDGTASVTGADGTSTVVYTAGTKAGKVGISATTSSVGPATFSLTLNPGDPMTVAAVSGDAQSAVAGATLAAPFVVLVVDEFGNAISGVTVTWTVDAGTLSNTTSVTDAAGNAQTTLTFSAGTGTRVVTATVAALAPVAFTAIAN